MAVAELTPILARSLLAQYVTIPALVQSPSFLLKANTIQHIYGFADLCTCKKMVRRNLFFWILALVQMRVHAWAWFVIFVQFVY